jgi:hypothetical protein
LNYKKKNEFYDVMLSYSRLMITPPHVAIFIIQFMILFIPAIVIFYDPKQHTPARPALCAFVCLSIVATFNWINGMRQNCSSKPAAEENPTAGEKV